MYQTPIPAAVTKNKLLIVEDDGEVCLLLHLLLHEKNIEVDHVRNLEKAVEFLRESQPDVIILDNKLPDGYGIELLAYIKSQYPNIKVVMISGYGSAVRDAAIEGGADDFMEKPFTRKQLMHSLAGFLN